jgi:hypothetical protein
MCSAAKAVANSAGLGTIVYERAGLATGGRVIQTPLGIFCMENH